MWYDRSNGGDALQLDSKVKCGSLHANQLPAIMRLIRVLVDLRAAPRVLLFGGSCIMGCGTIANIQLSLRFVD